MGAIKAKDYRAGEALAARALRFFPNDPEFLYPLATCQRSLQRYGKALETLSRLENARPRLAGTWLERGRIYEAQRQYLRAVSAYQRCTELNRAYVGAWVGLSNVARAVKNVELHNEAAEQIRYIQKLGIELVVVLRALYDGETYKAERLCRAFLKQHPRHVEAMRILASIGSQYGILDDAEFLLESAASFEPSNQRVRLDYIDVLHRRQKYGQALEEAQDLLARHPNNSLYQVAVANQMAAIGNFDEALDVYGDILDGQPNSPLASARLHLTRGHARKTTGKLDLAIEDYRAAYQKRADFGDAYWSLANLKTYQFTDDELHRLHELADSPDTQEEDKVHALFALGKSYEDSEEFESSFGFYEAGNALQRLRLNYDAENMTSRLRLHEEFCNREFFEARKDTGCSDPDPIFIVGLPRAGSTLLEQILASHSQVEGTLELHHMSTYAQSLDGRRRRDDAPRYPAILAKLSDREIETLGDRYIEETRIHRTQTPYFIDKMPNNFRHIGMISLVLPNAKIIDARRNPMACCFSGYKQLFASGQEFSYGQEDIGTYYRDYCRLMDHWDEALPGKVLRVYYESVVSDLETEVRRMLDYCGLPFEESCLRYYETERSIRTPSSEQVRRPIYREGVDQWRNFEPWLQPMKDALAPCVDEYPVPT